MRARVGDGPWCPARCSWVRCPRPARVRPVPRRGAALAPTQDIGSTKFSHGFRCRRSDGTSGGGGGHEERNGDEEAAGLGASALFGEPLVRLVTADGAAGAGRLGEPREQRQHRGVGEHAGVHLDRDIVESASREQAAVLTETRPALPTPVSPRTWYPSSAPRSSWDRSPAGRADPLCRPLKRGPSRRIRLPLGLTRRLSFPRPRTARRRRHRCGGALPGRVPGIRA